MKIEEAKHIAELLKQMEGLKDQERYAGEMESALRKEDRGIIINMECNNHLRKPISSIVINGDNAVVIVQMIKEYLKRRRLSIIQEISNYEAAGKEEMK